MARATPSGTPLVRVRMSFTPRQHPHHCLPLTSLPAETLLQGGLARWFEEYAAHQDQTNPTAWALPSAPHRGVLITPAHPPEITEILRAQTTDLRLGGYRESPLYRVLVRTPAGEVWKLARSTPPGESSIQQEMKILTKLGGISGVLASGVVASHPRGNTRYLPLLAPAWPPGSPTTGTALLTDTRALAQTLDQIHDRQVVVRHIESGVLWRDQRAVFADLSAAYHPAHLPADPQGIPTHATSREAFTAVVRHQLPALGTAARLALDQRQDRWGLGLSLLESLHQQKAPWQTRDLLGISGVDQSRVDLWVDQGLEHLAMDDPARVKLRPFLRCALDVQATCTLAQWRTLYQNL